MNPNTKTLESEEKNLTNSPLPAKKMHNIVMAMVGIFFLIAATYPLSMYRVAHKDDGWGEKVKVKGVYVKTLNDAKQTISRSEAIQTTEQK